MGTRALPEASASFAKPHLSSYGRHDLLKMGNDNAGGGGWDLANTSRRVQLVMAGFHCHAPACLGEPPPPEPPHPRAAATRSARARRCLPPREAE